MLFWLYSEISNHDLSLVAYIFCQKHAPAAFLSIFTLAGVFQSVFQLSKTAFVCGWKARTQRESYVFEKYLCLCGEGLSLSLVHFSYKVGNAVSWHLLLLWPLFFVFLPPIPVGYDNNLLTWNPVDTETQLKSLKELKRFEQVICKYGWVNQDVRLSDLMDVKHEFWNRLFKMHFYRLWWIPNLLFLLFYIC